MRIDEAKRELMIIALERHRGNRTHVARELGICIRTCRLWIKQLGLAERYPAPGREAEGGAPPESLRRASPAVSWELENERRLAQVSLARVGILTQALEEVCRRAGPGLRDFAREALEESDALRLEAKDRKLKECGSR